MISVAILARDEDRHIAAAIESVRSVAGEIVVFLDARTRDNTAAIARAHGAEVQIEPFRSHAAQRNLALRRCRSPWVLFLDADERLTPELATELQELRLGSSPEEGAAPPIAGYWIPRYNLYWGTRLRGGGWYPDRQLRLLRRDAAHYDERRLIHEYAELDGPAGALRGHLLHINIESLGELRRKQHGYALKEAQTLFLEGTRARPHNLVLQPLREVKRRFWTWNGYRDRGLGVVLALIMGYYEFVKYLHLWGLARATRRLNGV
jgi:glycosyltransferase involved in cell wall biosynthesis